MRVLGVLGGVALCLGLWIAFGFLAAGVWWLVTLGWGWWPL